MLQSLLVTVMQVEYIVSHLESEIKPRSALVQKSKSDMQQYMEGKFDSLRTQLNTMRSILYFDNCNKFGKRGNGVLDGEDDKEKPLPAI